MVIDIVLVTGGLLVCIGFVLMLTGYICVVLKVSRARTFICFGAQVGTIGLVIAMLASALNI